MVLLKDGSISPYMVLSSSIGVDSILNQEMNRRIMQQGRVQHWHAIL